MRAAMAGQLQVEHRNAVHDREDAAVAAENSVADVVGARAVKHRSDRLEPAAAVRTSQDVEGRRVHNRTSNLPDGFPIFPPRLSELLLPAAPR